MRALCRHGHLAFFPESSGDIGRFKRVFNRELTRVEDYYTFPELAEMPEYSIEKQKILGLEAIKTFEGKPWDVMRENGWVFHIALKKLVLPSTINASISLPWNGVVSIASNPLIQAGVQNAEGKRILSYDGNFSTRTFQLFVAEVSLE